MGMPVIVSSNIPRAQAITDIIESVALEQTALSHILNAEGKKIQKALEQCTTAETTTEHHLRVFDFVYHGESYYTGLNEQGVAFVVFKLTDSGVPLSVPVYCMDLTSPIAIGEHYTQEILQASTDLTEEHANRIRNILLKSFPYIPLASVRTQSGIANLTQQEAVTATQLAIWKLTNNFSMTHSNANVMALYQWYLALPPITVIIDPAEITLTAETFYTSETTCNVRFTFFTEGVNGDGSAIALAFSFNKNLVTEYGAAVSVTTIGTKKVVTVTNLPYGANFTITVQGQQFLPEDAFRYRNAQDLVGIFSARNLMSAQSEYTCRGDCTYKISEINKSVGNMVKSITNLELVLQGKLDLFADCLCEDDDAVTPPPNGGGGSVSF